MIEAVKDIRGVALLLYLSFTIIAYILLYVNNSERIKKKKIQQHDPRKGQIKRELILSLLSILVFTCVNLLITWAGNNKITRIYSNVDEYGYLYFGFSIFLMIVIQDTYFYWTHRLLHWKPMFKHVHKLHHLSVTPTPFSAYAFHPVEAFINVLILPVIVFIIPYHNNALTTFTICSLLFNIKGHMGYEFVPKKWSRYFLFKWLNSTTQHDKHHSLSNFNYGFYFPFWDAVMKTVHKEDTPVHKEDAPIHTDELSINDAAIAQEAYFKEEMAECA